MNKEQKIVFTDTFGVIDEYKPIPASFNLPDWYKSTNSFVTNEKKPINGLTPATIKKCMPVFDVLSHGYYILTHTDIFVTNKLDDDGNMQLWVQWANHEAVEFHPREQVPIHPKHHYGNVAKWMNPWGIKTPNGYSTLFIPPVHRDNVFSILEGVVDTDTYTSPVNFPMVLTHPYVGYDGLIPAGTPIAQVIPFKRDEWKMDFGGEKEKKIIENTQKQIRVKFFDGYKNIFRQNKSYK